MEQMKTSVGKGLVRHPDGASGAGTKSDEAASKAEPAGGQRLSAAVLPAVVGGLTGALCAVAAVLTILELRPPLDARLPALAQQVGGFQQELYSLETALRAAEVDVVRALDADRALSNRLDTQTASLEAAVAQVSDARQALQVDSGPGSAIFSIAVAQLAGATSSGGAFDSEWVTLYALSRGNDEVRAALSRLMPLAAEGIPTVEELRATLQARASEAGVAIVDPSNLYSYGLNALQSGLGVPIGTTAEQQVVSGLVTAADRQLAAGDIVSALEEMGKLTQEAAAPFASWLQQARRRALADAEVQKLVSLSTEALRARTKNEAG
jgi:hypothetical protein